MKTKQFIFSVGLVIGLASEALAQAGGDPTTPPAVVGKTMKTLDQVEARTPLVDGASGVSIASSLVTVNGTDYTSQAVTISEPGSYYLTENIIAGPGLPAISIDVDFVTLDLNGMSLLSADSNNIAIRVQGRSVTIKNGKIGLADGVAFVNGISGVRISGTTYTSLNKVSISGLQISDCSLYGINARGFGTKAESCSVSGSVFGIVANVVTECQAATSSTGIVGSSVVSRCSASVTNGTAIFGDVVENSTGYAEEGIGISGGTVKACQGESLGDEVSDHGIVATASSGRGIVIGSQGKANAGNGIDGGVVRDCVGSSTTGVSISADIGVSCLTSGTAPVITNKYNMP